MNKKTLIIAATAAGVSSLGTYLVMKRRENLMSVYIEELQTYIDMLTDELDSEYKKQYTGTTTGDEVKEAPKDAREFIRAATQEKVDPVAYHKIPSSKEGENMNDTGPDPAAGEYPKENDEEEVTNIFKALQEDTERTPAYELVSNEEGQDIQRRDGAETVEITVFSDYVMLDQNQQVLDMDMLLAPTGKTLEFMSEEEPLAYVVNNFTDTVFEITYDRRTYYQYVNDGE